MQTLTAPLAGNPNNAPLLLGIIWGEAAVLAAVVVARNVLETRLRKTFGWDGGWMLLAWAMALTTSAMDTVAMHFGLGQHAHDVSPSSQLSDALFWIWNAVTPASVWTVTTRTALACTILRMAPQRWHRSFIHICIWPLFALEIAQVVINYVQCHPVNRLWDPFVHARCWSPFIPTNIALAAGAYAAATTFVLSLFLLAFIFQLQVSPPSRAALIATLAAGILATVSAILQTLTTPNLTHRADVTWHSLSLTIWTTTSNNITMLAACIPVFSPLLKETAKHKRSRYVNSVELANGPWSFRRLPSRKRGFFSRGRSDATGMSLATQPTLPPLAFPSRFSLRYESSHSASPSRSEQSHRSLTFERPRSPPPLPTVARREVAHRSLLALPLSGMPGAGGRPKYSSPGYISREEQAYLGASTF